MRDIFAGLNDARNVSFGGADFHLVPEHNAWERTETGARNFH